MSDQNQMSANLAELLSEHTNNLEITPKTAGFNDEYLKQMAKHGGQRRNKLHPLMEKMAAECEKRLASDIFISTGFPPSFKINGELVPVPLKPLTDLDTQILVYSTMTPEQRAKFDQDLELNYSATASQRA